LKGKAIILTCEHAGNMVPEMFAGLFQGREDVLNSHRGWDPGALEIARHLSDHLEAPLYYRMLTRLLIELNRSLHHAQLYSEFSRSLDKEGKAFLLNYYNAYRDEVIDKINELLKTHNQVLHFSIHTFTPELDGEVRIADLGILFDPDRAAEKKFSLSLQRELASLVPRFGAMFNYPYLGTDDGFTTWLRQEFDDRYLGIELEVNQKHVGQPEIEEIKQGLADALVVGC
jgi:predicted N-formylglutamate amidohydrolase